MTTTAKKRPFPLGRVREIAAHVKNLHECLTDVLAEYDAAPTDAPASDNSDAGTTWGEDSARRASAADTPTGKALAKALAKRDLSHC